MEAVKWVWDLENPNPPHDFHMFARALKHKIKPDFVRVDKSDVYGWDDTHKLWIWDANLENLSARVHQAFSEVFPRNINTDKLHRYVGVPRWRSDVMKELIPMLTEVKDMRTGNRFLLHFNCGKTLDFSTPGVVPEPRDGVREDYNCMTCPIDYVRVPAELEAKIAACCQHLHRMFSENPEFSIEMDGEATTMMKDLEEHSDLLKFVNPIHNDYDMSIWELRQWARISGCGCFREFITWWGKHGSNRKSSTTALLRYMLGETNVAGCDAPGYLSSIPADVLSVKAGPGKVGRAAYNMRGARIALIDELRDGDALNEQTLKLWADSPTGGFSVTVGKNKHIIKPTWVLMVYTNVIPKFSKGDTALDSRYALVNMSRRFQIDAAEGGLRVNPMISNMFPVIAAECICWIRYLAVGLSGHATPYIMPRPLAVTETLDERDSPKASDETPEQRRHLDELIAKIWKFSDALAMYTEEEQASCTLQPTVGSVINEGLRKRGIKAPFTLLKGRGFEYRTWWNADHTVSIRAYWYNGDFVVVETDEGSEDQS